MIKNVCKLPKELGCRLYVWLQLQLQWPKSKEFLFTNQVTVAEMSEKKYFATFRGLKFTKTQILTIWKGTVCIWVTVRSFYCLLSVGSKFLRPSSFSCFFLLLFLTWGAHFWKLVFGEKMFWKQKLNLPLGCVKNEVMSLFWAWVISSNVSSHMARPFAFCFVFYTNTRWQLKYISSQIGIFSSLSFSWLVIYQMDWTKICRNREFETW